MRLLLPLILAASLAAVDESTQLELLTLKSEYASVVKNGGHLNDQTYFKLRKIVSGGFKTMNLSGAYRVPTAQSS